MTDIITFDVKKPIENSINELVKNLSNDIEKKIREDIINNILTNITTKSIYGLDDFGKFNEELTTVFKENEYFILRYKGRVIKEEGGCTFTGDVYITNIIDGLLLSNDDILLLALLSIKYLSGCSISNNFIKYLVQNNYIDVDFQTSFLQNKLDKSLKRYFASVHDNKIKAFEFDKLLKKYKDLEVSINNNKKELDESKDKYEISNDENGMYKDVIKNTELEINKQKEIIIDLENKNKNLEEEIIKQSKKLKEIKEIEILNLEEEYNKLFTVFTETKDELNKTKEENNKTKEENIKLSDEWLILKDKTIAKFEEDNYKLRMEKDKLIKKIAELEKKTE